MGGSLAAAACSAPDVFRRSRMPPVSPQGSRTALVTWSVVFCVLFVTCAVFAIYFYADDVKARDAQEIMRKSYADVIPEQNLSSQQISDLKSLRGTEPYNA